MKASEVIKRIAELIELQGDREVLLWEFPDCGHEACAREVPPQKIEMSEHGPYIVIR